MPTSYAAPPLNAVIVDSETGNPPVWSDAEGTVRGYALEPLFRSVPKAARRDPKLYELLALTDALREGRARERKLAQEALKKRLAGASDG